MSTPLRLALERRYGAAEAQAILSRWRRAFVLAEAIEETPSVVPDRHQEFEDLLALLTEHAMERSVATRSLARWIAYSCMGDNHLWEDLGLPDRPELTRLMQDLFPTLRALNRANMRWKKFFYKQLCERADVFTCRSPSCDVCNEYDACFGPEVRSAPATAPASAGLSVS